MDFMDFMNAASVLSPQLYPSLLPSRPPRLPHIHSIPQEQILSWLSVLHLEPTVSLAKDVSDVRAVADRGPRVHLAAGRLRERNSTVS